MDSILNLKEFRSIKGILETPRTTNKVSRRNSQHSLSSRREPSKIQVSNEHPSQKCFQAYQRSYEYIKHMNSLYSQGRDSTDRAQTAQENFRNKEVKIESNFKECLRNELKNLPKAQSRPSTARKISPRPAKIQKKQNEWHKMYVKEHVLGLEYQKLAVNLTVEHRKRKCGLCREILCVCASNLKDKFLVGYLNEKAFKESKMRYLKEEIERLEKKEKEKKEEKRKKRNNISDLDLLVENLPKWEIEYEKYGLLELKDDESELSDSKMYSSFGPDHLESKFFMKPKKAQPVRPNSVKPKLFNSSKKK